MSLDLGKEHSTDDELLVDYLPEAIQSSVREGIARARRLFENERHYEVLQIIESIIKVCSDALVDMPNEVEGKVETKAAKAASSIIASSSQGSNPAPPMPTHLSLSLFIKQMESWPLYTTAKSRAKACDELVEDLDNTDRWSKVNVYSDGTGTYHRSDAAGHQYFKVIGNIKVNVLYTVCTIMELDLYSEWFPLCNFSQTQGDISRFHRSSFFVVSSPWPFANREAFLQGYGIDDLKLNSRILIVSRSLHEDQEDLPQGINAPPRISGNVRCDVLYGGFRIEVTSPTTSRLSFIMSVDPKIPNIPKAALNWVCGKVMWKILADIQKAAKRSQDRKSKYYARRRERPEVYQLFRTRFHAVLKRLLPNDYEQYLLPEDY